MVFWLNSLCFGSFRLTDDIADLRWVGAGGLIQVPGVVALAVLVSSRAGSVAFALWLARRSRAILPASVAELDAMEGAWKVERLREAEAATAGLAADQRAEVAEPTEDVPGLGPLLSDLVREGAMEGIDVDFPKERHLDPSCTEATTEPETEPEAPSPSKWRLHCQRQLDVDEWIVPEPGAMTHCWPSCMVSSSTSVHDLDFGRTDELFV